MTRSRSRRRLFQGVHPHMLKLYTMACLAIQARLAAAKDRGATAVEYGLMIALIAAVIVTVVVLLGAEIKAAFDHTCDKIAAGSVDSGNGTCAAGS